MTKAATTLFIWLFLSVNSYALDLIGRVNDYAGVLTQAQRATLEAKLTAIENLPNHPQVVVLTVKTLGGADLEQYATQQLREWKLGQASHDNGILVLNAIAERKVRIEVGYGLEGDVPDAIAKVIISQVMVPFLKQGDYFGAYSNAIDQIQARLPQEATTAKFSSQPSTEGPDYFWAIIAAIVAAFIGLAWWINRSLRRQRDSEREMFSAAEAQLRRQQEASQMARSQGTYQGSYRSTPLRPSSHVSSNEAELRRQRDAAERRAREAEAAASAASYQSLTSSSSSSSSSDSGWSSSSSDFSGGGGSSGGGGASGDY